MSRPMIAHPRALASQRAGRHVVGDPTDRPGQRRTDGEAERSGDRDHPHNVHPTTRTSVTVTIAI
jgi:hypothetical protein